MRKGCIILLFLIIIFISLNTVSSADDNIFLNESSSNLADSLSFKDLNKSIAENNQVTFNKSYVYNSLDGNFSDGIAINKSITIDGKGYSIDAKNNGRIFNISASNVIGGAIFISNKCENITIDNSTFLNNKHSNKGGAIYCNASNTLINNSQFYNNNALIGGGAIYFEGSNGLVENSTFRENTAILSGSAIYWEGQTGTILSSKFNKNYNNLYASVFWGAPNGKIINSFFIDNTADGCGALDVHYDATNLSVSKSAFINNKGEQADAILWLANDGEIINSIFISKQNTNFVNSERKEIDVKLDYNWWGQTNNNYQTNIVTIPVNNWLFLNISSENELLINETNEITISLSNLFNKTGVNLYDKYDLPTVNLSISAINATTNTNYITLKDGSAKILLTPNEKFSTLTASFYGHTFTQKFIVRSELSLNISIPDVTYTTKPIAYLNADLDGKYKLIVNNKTYNVTIKNKRAKVILDKLNATESNYTAFFIFEGNTTHFYAENKTNFKVNKFNNFLSVYIPDIGYQVNGTAYIEADADGKYILSINGSDYEFNVVNGLGKVIFKQLNQGNYDAILTFNNSNFINHINSTKFNVIPAKYLINLTSNKIYYPTNVISIWGSVDGIYYLTINNKTYNVNVKNNKCTVEIDLLSPNKYSVNITYSDTENYTSTIFNYELEVIKGNNSLKLEVNNVTYSDNVMINVFASVDGEYSIIFGGITYNLTVINGKGNITLNKQPIGIYTVNLSYDNENYLNHENQTLFKVAKFNNNLKISVNNVNYNEEIIAVINASVDGKYTVIVNGKEYNVTVDKGCAFVSLDTLNSGTYNAYLKFVENNDYAISFNFTSFEIFKLNNYLKLEADNITYKENVIFYINASVDGDYCIFINNNSYNITVKNNKANLTLSDFAAGKYLANLTLLSNNYINPSNTTEFQIFKQINTLMLSIDDATYPENITAKVTASVDGVYSLMIDKNYEFNVTNGIGNISLLVPAGFYTAYLTLKDNENYTNIINQTDLIVEQGICNFVVNVDDVGYGDYIVVEVESDVEGIYIATIPGIDESYEIYVSNGYGNVSIPNNLSLGQHEVNIIFAFDENYEFSINSTIFNVIKGDITLNITINNITYCNDLIVKVVSNFDGIYTITIKDEDYNLTVLNGIGQIAIPDLYVDKYTALIKTEESENYKKLNKSVNFSVDKAVDYYYELNIFPTTYGGNISVSMTINDATGYISINDKYKDALDGGNAFIEIPNLPVGDYDLNIFYSGDGNFSSLIINESVSVFTSIDASNSIRAYNSPYDFKAVLYNHDVVGLMDQKVIVKVDGVTKNIFTDGYGIITLSKLSIGLHKIIITNPETKEVASFTVKVISRFSNNKNIVSGYLDGSKYTVRVYDDDGSIAQGANVIFNINGKKITVKSDKNGYASLTISELPKKYTITATYAEQSVNNTVTVKQNLKAVKSTTIVKKSSKKFVLKASYKYLNGKGIAGKKIIFKFNGKKYITKTNSKGIAKVTINKNVIKKLRRGKKYIVTITHVQNTVKASVKVKR